MWNPSYFCPLYYFGHGSQISTQRRNCNIDWFAYSTLSSTGKSDMVLVSPFPSVQDALTDLLQPIPSINAVHIWLWMGSTAIPLAQDERGALFNLSDNRSLDILLGKLEVYYQQCRIRWEVRRYNWEPHRCEFHLPLCSFLRLMHQWFGRSYTGWALLIKLSGFDSR